MLTRRELVRRGARVGFPEMTPRARRRLYGGGGEPYRGPIVVSLFLRGGADGLNIVPPWNEGRYYELRPTLALGEPGSGEGAALDLDGRFGLHPALAPLLPLWQEGSLALVHAAGNPSDSHSHFSSQDYMERGRDGQTSDTTGWLGRHLSTLGRINPSPFRAVAVGGAVQKSLLGQVPAFGIAEIESYALSVRGADPAVIRDALLSLYSDPEAALDVTTRQVFTAMDALTDVPPGGDGYPGSDLGRGLSTLARLIKADLGVEVATVDSGGWDHHADLAAELEARLTDLGGAVTAFLGDLGEHAGRVSVVVMTEFGRRAYENASGGADHGHGGVMLALGAGVNGGVVYHDWPGLGSGQLYGAGDLEVTSDFRTVLAGLLAVRAGHPDVGQVFPEVDSGNLLGVFRSG